MIERAQVIGAGGASARQSPRDSRERGVAVRTEATPDLVLLCVPDARDRRGRRAIDPGPWVAHVSGATPLAALDPHAAASGAPAPDVHARARSRAARRRLGGRHGRDRRGARDGDRLARTLGLRPFDIDGREAARCTTPAPRSRRTTSSPCTAPRRGCFEAAGAPPEALVPLMRRTIENGFELTGPIARGDWETVERAPARDPRGAPGARADVRAAGRGDARHEDRPHDRRGARRLAPLRSTAAIGLVPTMGALARRTRRAVPRRARRERRRGRQPFRQSGAVRRPEDLAAYPRDEARDAELRRGAGVDLLFAPAADEMYPPGFQTWVDVEELLARLEGDYRPGHFRGVATVCLKLFNIVRPHAPTSVRRTRSRSPSSAHGRATSISSSRSAWSPTVRDADGLALSSRNAQLSPDGARSARSRLPRALATARRDRAGATPLPRDRPRRSTTSTIADFDGRHVLAAAVARRHDPPDRQRRPRRSQSMTTRPRKPGPNAPAPGKLPLPELAEMKRRGEKIVDGDRLRRAQRAARRRRPAST